MSSSLPSSWITAEIGQLCDVGRGSSPRPIRDERYFEGGDIPWVKIADATRSGKYLYKTKQYVNEYGASFSRLLPAGTILVAASGTLGYTQILGVEGCVHDGWLFLTNLKIVDKDYLYYALQHMEQHFYNTAYGAAIQNINTHILRRTEIPYPPLPTQRRIGAILSAYDDLIENNLRRIEILEEMGRLLYREWFVRFGFPGHEKVEFADSASAPIAKGWKVEGILNIPHFRFIAENVRPYEGKKRYFATAEVKGVEMVGQGAEYSYADKPSRAQKCPVLNSVWFARMKDTYKVLPFAAANKALAHSCLLSSGFVGFEAVSPGWFGFLFFTINSQEFHEKKDLYCTGATQMSLTNEGLGRIQILVPDNRVAVSYGRFVEPMVDQILTLQARNVVLRTTRDLLLPRLVSGELDVEGVEVH